MCLHMAEKDGFGNAKKNDFFEQMEFRKRSILDVGKSIAHPLFTKIFFQKECTHLYEIFLPGITGFRSAAPAVVHFESFS